MNHPISAAVAASSTAASNWRANFWSDLLQGFWRVGLLNTFIAFVLWSARVGNFLTELAYSQAIGMSMWLIIQFGRLWLVRDSDPGAFPTGWRALLLIGGGIVGGFMIGSALGTLIAGLSLQGLMGMKAELVWSLFLMSAAIGAMATYYFYVEGKSADLARELERSQRQAAQAQLKLLESQLEPHMLFNTLANLRVLIGTDPTRATHMLDRLNDYLRATLSASRAGTHSLSAEFDRLRDYLELMAVRMGPRLQFVLELPPALQDLPVPPLLLQPLVENSIKHGLEPSVGGGQIHVRAQVEGHALALEVIDTGVGMESSPKSETGFGLSQVRERLATTYGPQATLEQVANAPVGTIVRITIPLKS